MKTWMLSVMAFIQSALLGWAIIPLALHTRADVGDIDGTKVARLLSIHIFLRLPSNSVVAFLGHFAELPCSLCALLGFLIAAWAPKHEDALLAMMVLTSPLVALRSTVNIRMKAASGTSQAALSQASTVCNRGRTLGRIFRSVTVASLYQVWGFDTACLAGAALAGAFLLIAIAHPTGTVVAGSGKDESVKQADSCLTVVRNTRWIVWALAFFFSMHEFSANALIVSYPIVASRDVGLSEATVGLVHSCGLAVALILEFIVARLPSQCLLKSPLHLPILRLAYANGLHMLPFVSTSVPTFVAIVWITVSSETFLQKSLMESVVGAAPSASQPIVLAAMEVMGGLFATAGIATGARLTGIDSTTALNTMAMIAILHGAVETCCFGAVAHSYFGRRGALAKGERIQWLKALLLFQRENCFMDAIKELPSDLPGMKNSKDK